MKCLILHFAFATVIFTFLISKVHGVPCTINEECKNSTSCVGANTPICEHEDLSDINEWGGLCTCSVGACFTADDCKQVDVVLECSYAERHCYDNKCICSRFPIFPGK